MDLPRAQYLSLEQAELEGEGRERQFVTALARGLEVLRAFRDSDIALGNHEIAERTGLPKPTVSRLTYTLCKLGYLSCPERSGKYRLGAGVLALGYAMLSGMDIRQRARPLLQELASHANATVALGSRDRLEMVYVECCRGPGAVTLSLDVGSRVPIATTAMGRALLAALPAEERAYLLDHIRQRQPDDFPRIAAGVEQAMTDIAERGFCFSLGDWHKDVHAVGVPLVLPHRAAVFALNCGGPSFMLPPEALAQDIGPRLNAIARALTSSQAG